MAGRHALDALALRMVRIVEGADLVEILARIEGGAKLAGTYPPNAETRAAYEAARSNKGA